MDMNETVTLISESSTLMEWFAAIGEISSFIYLFPFYGFFILLVIGYSLFSRDIVDGMLVASFFGMFISLAMVALNLIAYYNVAVMLAFFVTAIILKVMMGVRQP